MREYELVLMLDPGQDGPARDAVAQEARRMIEGSGALKHENVWGLRKLAYEIAQRNEADYRWFRFEAPSELLEQLDHSLKITDGVLRFRIFKVGPETPIMVPPATAAPGPGASRERPRERGPETAPEADAQAPSDGDGAAATDGEPAADQSAEAAPGTGDAGAEDASEQAAAGEGDEPARTAQ